MIFRHFADPNRMGHSYLVASTDSNDAVIVNPIASEIDSYRAALDELGLRLVHTLETGPAHRSGSASHALRDCLGSTRIAHVSDPGLRDVTGGAVDVNAEPGTAIPLGELEIRIIEAPIDDDTFVAYVIGGYTFCGDSVLIGHEGASADSHVEGGSSKLPTTSAHRPSPVRNLRDSREGVLVERLILEDLHSSLIENRFTPKETRVTLAYIRYLEEHDFDPPTAEALALELGDVDRTAVHVLVHNIRWRQIRMERLPLLLAGQTSKWLKGLQTEPSFTEHEKEFLAAYLELVRENRQPPSGPEIALALPEKRSVQWVRKRAHTIRRKQKEFQMPTLILTRKNASAGVDEPRNAGLMIEEEQRCGA